MKVSANYATQKRKIRGRMENWLARMESMWEKVVEVCMRGLLSISEMPEGWKKKATL